MDKLPCNCGGVAYVVKYSLEPLPLGWDSYVVGHTFPRYFYRIECSRCGQILDKNFNTPEAAKEMWNKVFLGR